MENQKICAKERFCELRSDEFCDTLESYNVSFHHKVLAPSGTPKVFHIIAEGGYLLQALETFSALKEVSQNTLYVTPKDNVDALKIMIEVFGLPQYAYLVIIGSNITRECDTIVGELRKTLKHFENKTVIVIEGRKNSLARQISWDDDIIAVVEKHVTFKDFTKACQRRLWLKRSVMFQGEEVSLAELFGSETSDGYEAALSEEILEDLVRNEYIRVGSEAPGLPPENWYVSRVLKNIGEEIEEADILDKSGKIVLIEGGAGSGKSAFLAKLAATIKSQWWVIAIKLEDYITVFSKCQGQGRNKLTPLELLDAREATKLATPFEKFVFSKSKKVVLMLDDIEEAWIDYAPLILSLLSECRSASHISKVIITSRPHVAEQLEEELQITAFTLQPFTNQKLKEFLVAYWTHHLRLGNMNDKCERYATELIAEVSLHRETEGYFVPLFAKVLAELSNQSDSLEDWEGCNEYLRASRKKPQISKILVVRLIERFIEETRHIFIAKTHPKGNTMTRQIFEECLVLHQLLAVDVVLGENICALFRSTRQVDKNMEADILRIGIIQKRNNKFHFSCKTVAEYFVAEGLLTELLLVNVSVEFQKYFIEEFLVDSRFVGVRVFLDNSLKMVVDDLPSNIFEKYQSLPCHTTMTENWGKLIHRLAEDDCPAILQLVLDRTECHANIAVRNKFGDTPLHVVALKGHLSTAKLIVGRGANVNTTNDDGWAPLHFAALGDHLATVKFLVERGADVNVTNNYKETPLLSAAWWGYSDIVEYLVDQGASVNVTNNAGETSIHYAALRSHLDTVKYLVDQGANVNITNDAGETPLHYAALRSHLDTVKFLVERGANTNITRDDCETPLRFTAWWNQSKTVRFLVEQGTDVTITKKHYETVLHSVSAWWDHLDIVKLLVERGANIKMTSDYCETPQHSDVLRGRLDTVKFLVERGANVNVQSDERETPLHFAALGVHLDTVKFLVEQGANVDIKNDVDETSLHFAAAGGHLDTVKFLVEQGGDVDITKDDGESPLHSAALKNHLDVVRFLVEQGANVNITCDEGETPLHSAAWRGHLDTVKYLVEQGANVNVTNDDGETPLHCAAWGGHLDTVKFFVGRGADVNVLNRFSFTASDLASRSDIVRYLNKRTNVNIRGSRETLKGCCCLLL